jgi:hypothetical protein
LKKCAACDANILDGQWLCKECKTGKTFTITDSSQANKTTAIREVSAN